MKNRDDFDIIDGIASFKSTAKREALETDFFAWLNIKTEYDQIRIINNSGMELIRVNYNNGNPAIIDSNELQNKASRYYFLNSINLSDNSIYMSKLDLNVENNEIEYIDGSPKPMLRIASPIFNSNDEKIGIIIVNYLADHLFNDTETMTGDYTEFEVINDSGYYLHSLNEDIEFGFMFDDKEDETFSAYHSYDIFNITGSSVNQNVYDGELYTSLLITNIKMSDAISDFLGQEISVYSDNGDILLFGEVDIRDTSEFETLRNSYLIFVSVSLLFALIISRLLDELNFSRKERISTLEYNSKYDSLTGIPNRSNFYNFIEELNQKQELYTILFLDLDRFKDVNDEFGHAIGDEVLKDCARRIANVVRKTDMVARIGGDEFVLALAGLNEKDDINSITCKIRDEIKKPFIYENIKCNIGVSIGVAIQDGTLKIDDILSLADKRMYSNKKRTRNTG